MTDAPSGPRPTDTAAAAARTVTLTDLLRVPVHRIGVVAAGALVGLLAALTYVLVVPSAVTANAVVAVRPVVTDAFSPSGANADRAVNMNVESGIATGTEVAQRLADQTGREKRVVRDALEVEVPTGGQILRFLYTADSADAAVEGVNLAAQAYLDLRRTMYERQRAEILRSYDASITKVTAQQTALQRRIANAKADAADATVAELSGINSQLTQLNTARTEIAAVDVNPGWVTRQAERSLVSAGGSRLLLLLAGLLGGALLGVVLAYLRETTDRRIRSVDDGRDATGLPLLGTVRGRRLRSSRRSVDADIRYLAMAVAEWVREPARVVLLTTREDQSALTAGLAVALATPGRDVYVADDSGRGDRLREIVLTDRGRLPVVANPVRPAVSTPREGGRPPGDDVVEQLQARRPSPRPAVGRASPHPETTLTLSLPTGAPVGAGSTIGDGGGEVTVGAGGVRFGTWQSRPSTGLVLFNAPPAEADERGVAAARQGTAVVVVERDRTRQSDLRRLTERLRAAGVTPLGFVLTRAGRG